VAVKGLGLALALLLALAHTPLTLASLRPAQEGEKVSAPGRYLGYSEPLYTEWVRTSQYVAARDGTRLAVDVFRPARSGQPVDEPLQAVWSHTRYHRAQASGGQVQTILDSTPWLKTLLKHGYVVAVADVRGSGASYGTRLGSYSLQDARDAYDITEWLAAQPWCDGKVGMYGESFMGGGQLMVASLAPPHLKAIVPRVAPFDRYAEYYPGGVFAEQAAASWSQTIKELDASLAGAPVDEDKDGALLAEAVAEHQANADFYQLVAALPYRDSAATGVGDGDGGQLWLSWGASNYLPEIGRSGIAVYHMAGWYDPYRLGALLAFGNLDNPQKVLIGPWTHTRYGEYFDLGAEHLRWYDYWLKGIDNGIMDEHPVYYYTLGMDEMAAWRFASEWPPFGAYSMAYYLHAGPSRSVRSANDGVLDTAPPAASSGQDDYIVDYTTTTNEGPKWNDRRGLTYTTPPLPADVQVVGHPVVHLWVSSTASDGDFFVTLEEVSPKGVSTYVTDGVLRASHRVMIEAIGVSRVEHWGLLDHRGYAQDISDLPPGQPEELVFDLLPTAKLFRAGSRIRVTITCADQGNMASPVLSPPPKVSIYRNADHASYIFLPMLPLDAPAGMIQKAPPKPPVALALAVVAGALIVAVIAAALLARLPRA
jgi:putative CocE/NonD family hydrolase